MYLVFILKYSNVRVFSIHTLNNFKSIHCQHCILVRVYLTFLNSIPFLETYNPICLPISRKISTENSIIS